jgi:hypothetical protein
MPGSTTSDSRARAFWCEHAKAKSRVLALVVGPDRHPTLEAVLSCADRALAERCATYLTAVSQHGLARASRAELLDIVESLPAAPRASLISALACVGENRWLPHGGHADLDDLLETMGLDIGRPPSRGARLYDYRGPVVRCIQLNEVHVHDRERLLAAARAAGWRPEGPDDADDAAGTDDLLGAVLHFLQPDEPVPGADEVTAAATLQLLRPERGDEVCDWSTRPIGAYFGPSRPRPQPGDPDETDFAELFGDRSCGCGDRACELCGSWQLTPRTANAIATALALLSDWIYDDVEQHGSRPVDEDGFWRVLGRLPRFTWWQDTFWRRRLARSCDDLRADIEEGFWPEPSCRAEEVVLHMAIEDAGALVLMWKDDPKHRHHLLPRFRDDYDWARCSEILFRDEGARSVFERVLVGVDAVDSLTELPMSDPRADTWFEVFSGEEVRDPRRGFRR